jgi:histidinol-phosphate aminotransferase
LQVSHVPAGAQTPWVAQQWPDLHESKPMTDFRRESLRALTPAFSFPTRPEDRGLVNLRDNENPFGGHHNRYPDNATSQLAHCYLKALEVIEERPASAGEEDRMLLTRGAGDALDLVFRALFEPGRDAIAIATPSFRLFDELALAQGLQLHRVPRQGENFDHIDVNMLCALPVKGIVLCNPNNPMGTSIHPSDIADLLARFDGLVVIDEAYVEYSRRLSYRHAIAEHPNLVVVRSMSKALAMAGLRLGAVFAQAHLIQEMRKVRLPFTLPRVVVDAALLELSDPQRLVEQIGRFIAERDRFADRLRRLPGIERVYADAGFVTVRANTSLARHLLACGFDTVPNPMGWPGHIRISIGMPEINDRVILAINNDNFKENLQ